MTADDRSWLTADYPELRDGPPWVMHDMVLAERELPAGIVGLPGVEALAAPYARRWRPGSRSS